MRISIPQLTSLRFFAAALIVIQHSAPYFQVLDSVIYRYTLIQGVTFFFVLSGFILTYSYSHLSGYSQAGRFLWARVARVWPVHIVTTGIFLFLWLVVFPTGLTVNLGEALANTFLLQSWALLPSYYFSMNGVSWTLSVEMFFYALFPFLIVGFDKRWPMLLALSMILACACIYAASYMGLPSYSGTDEITTASLVYIFPPARLFEFVLGMVAGHYFIRFGQAVYTSRLSGTAGAAGLAIIVWSGMTVPDIGWIMHAKGEIGDALKGWITVSAAAPLFALGIFLLASSKGIVTRALSIKPLVLLGEISFSVYLTHQLIIRSMAINPQWADGVDISLVIAAYWLLTIISSYVLWRWVEKPCQKLMLSLNKPKPAKGDAYAGVTQQRPA